MLSILEPLNYFSVIKKREIITEDEDRNIVNSQKKKMFCGRVVK